MIQYERCEAYVNLDAIRHNMDVMHEGISKDAKMVAVIKADGYGHGAREIANEIESLDYLYGFATATIEEAVELRRHGVKKPIMILGYVFPSQYELAVKEDILLPVFSYETAKALSDAALQSGKTAKFQIVIDTGMNRIGYKVTPESVNEILQMINLPNIEAEGMFTHFFLADAADKTQMRKQYDAFLRMVSMLKEKGVYIPNVHCANSAALVDTPDVSLNLVRAGITLYGLTPSDEVKKIDLWPVMEVRARIVHVKDVQPGETIGYGGTYTVQTPSRIATVNVGYADGYPRGLSNKGSVLIHGQRAPIRGRVCMDQFMIDVTDIAGVKVGDEVVLIGRDQDDCITMEELGELSGRFNYELACLIGKRVPRIYLKNGVMNGVRDAFSLDEIQ